MATAENLKVENETRESVETDFIDGDFLEIPSSENVALANEESTKLAPKSEPKNKTQNQILYLQYIALPVVFLTVALLGGLRLSQTDDAFIFLKPALICLIFAVVLLVLFFRSGLIKIEGWFSENFSTLRNIANASILLTLFFASAQIFNSLLPEKGLPFWIFAFCFFWTFWNNLFAEFQGKRLLQSLGSVFALAFVAKYLILSYLIAPTSESWWRGILENPTQEFFTYLFDLPRFAEGTGYIQFFAVILYLFGLFLLPSKPSKG